MRVVLVCLRGSCAGLTERAGEPLLLLSTGHLPAAAIDGLAALFEQVTVELGRESDGDDLLSVLHACERLGLDGPELDWMGELLTPTRVTFRRPAVPAQRATKGPSRTLHRCARSSAAVVAALTLAICGHLPPPARAHSVQRLLLQDKALYA